LFERFIHVCSACILVCCLLACCGIQLCACSLYSCSLLQFLLTLYINLFFARLLWFMVCLLLVLSLTYCNINLFAFLINVCSLMMNISFACSLAFRQLWFIHLRTHLLWCLLIVVDYLLSYKCLIIYCGWFICLLTGLLGVIVYRFTNICSLIAILAWILVNCLLASLLAYWELLFIASPIFARLLSLHQYLVAYCGLWSAYSLYSRSLIVI